MKPTPAQAELARRFHDHYGRPPSVVARAPGRLEILGNHTDYNEGYVLSAAVDRETLCALAPISGKDCSIKDFRDGSEKTFAIDSVGEPIPGDWTNYVRGVCNEFRKSGYAISAFQCAIFSTVPLSAGMSSSAALEMSFALAGAAVFGIELPATEMARLGQRVENLYVGVQSGLLDQFSSLFGRKDSVILCDFRKVAVIGTFPAPANFSIVVANSMVKHNLVDSEYNERRTRCENAVRAIRNLYPDVTALRDVSIDTLETAKPSMDLTDYRRALHVVGENDRVMKAVEALGKNDSKTFGELLRKSHESSIKNFENSCPELDYLVELSQSIPGCPGARLSGGGFGGISIHWVETSETDAYTKRLKTAYQLKTGVEPETLVCSFGDGASVTSCSL